MVLLLSLVGVALGECPAHPATLEDSLDRAQLAFSRLDAAVFVRESDEVMREAGCLVEPIAPADAARLHRTSGLREFVSGREDTASEAFAAARAIEPTWMFPESFVPPDHPIRRLYDDARASSRAGVDAPPPALGHLEFDGVVSRRRPADRATLAVLVGPTGEVTDSAYLWPGDPLFDYLIAAPVAEPVDAPVATLPGPLPASPPRRRRPTLPLALVAGASAVASGACYAIALDTSQTFWTPGAPAADLPALQQRTNVLYVTSVGAAVLALGTGVGAVVSGVW
ncbi:MAG: hypothetical protein Q8P18_28695 [Pseudomonadota bacterium]|nr:hypothetical protein [Pseudomonadota bacterium]